MDDKKKQYMELKGKIIECGRLAGFLVEAHNGDTVRTSKVSKETLMQFMLKGIHVIGAEMFQNHLMFKNGVLESLVIVKDSLVLKEEIKDEQQNTVGYVVANEDGSSERKLDLLTTWKLAASDNIKNAKAYVRKSDNKKLICSAL